MSAGQDPERAKGLIRRLFAEVLNEGKLGFLDSLIGSDYVEHSPAPVQAQGAEGVKAKVRDLRAAFPDIRFTLEELIAEGEILAARYHWQGTHRGSYLGIPPTGRAIVVRGMDFYRISGGRLVEHWDTIDEFGMLSQLGDLG
jgi:steroid delta-isomerase-like uncharacterized protein